MTFGLTGWVGTSKTRPSGNSSLLQIAWALSRFSALSTTLFSALNQRANVISSRDCIPASPPYKNQAPELVMTSTRVWRRWYSRTEPSRRRSASTCSFLRIVYIVPVMRDLPQWVAHCRIRSVWAPYSGLLHEEADLKAKLPLEVAPAGLCHRTKRKRCRSAVSRVSYLRPAFRVFALHEKWVQRKAHRCYLQKLLFNGLCSIPESFGQLSDSGLLFFRCHLRCMVEAEHWNLIDCCLLCTCVALKPIE